MTVELKMAVEIKKESKAQTPGAAPLTEEISHLLKAAEQGDAAAQFALAYRYEMGQGVMINLPEAVRWYEKAALQKHPVATYRLGRCCQEGKGTKKDTKRAQKLFLEAMPGLQEAAAKKDADAQVALGRCCHEGWVVPKDDAQGTIWFRAAAEQGHALGQYNLGWCYSTGTGVAKDKKEAAEWYRAAAEQGVALAYFELGLCYSKGTGVAKDEAQAVILIRKAAEQGYGVAQCSLGRHFATGTGVAKDEKEAVVWYRAAAEQSDVSAQRNLGICYANGTGVAEDQVEAVKWYKVAAEQGNAISQRLLGGCYAQGKGVEKDEVKAVRWYRAAAEQKNAFACLNLAICYANGTGVAKDEAQAVVWYRASAEQGNAVAQRKLATCYAIGRGIAKDEKEAVVWYRAAAEQGNAVAQRKLATCYANGTGVVKDEAQAVVWYRAAAEQGDVDAQSKLGACYAIGRGIAKDEKEAVVWYRAAAEQGKVGAQRNLGICYANGTGVAEDQVEAVKWYRAAAEQKNAVACLNLAACYANGIGVAEDQAEAVKWYRAAANEGNVLAQGKLGWHLGSGTGVPKDEAQALLWVRKAAAQGDASSQRYLGGHYDEGICVAQDKVEAIKWWRAAAKQGDGYAQMYLANICVTGLPGVIKKDEMQAMVLLKAALEGGIVEARPHLEALLKTSPILKTADQGDANAQFTIAYQYETGQGAPINPPEAVKWYEKAALQKHPLALYRLGRCCYYGEGTPKDPEKAQKLFAEAMPELKKMSDKKNADAQVALGECYQEGWVVAKNETQAVALYRPAAKRGNSLAQYKLGKCLANGTGVSKNEKEAASCYQASAKQGNALAQYNLGWCFTNGIGVGKDEKQAVYWYQQAAEQGNPLALCHLARCYWYGSGVPKDEAQAVFWYQKAVVHEQTQTLAQTSLNALFKANPDLARSAAVSSPAPAATTLESKEKKSGPLSVSASLESPPASPLAAMPAKAPLKADQDEIKPASYPETTLVPHEQKAPASLDQETLDALMALSKMPQTLVTQLQDLQREAKGKAAQLVEYRSELTRLTDKVGNVDGSALVALQGRTAELQSLIAKESDEQQAEQERQHILSQDKLSGFYYMFIRQFTGTWLACKTIQSGKVGNIEKTKLDYMAAGLDQMGKHIPGISILTEIVETAITTWSGIDKKRAVIRMADFFGTLVHTDQLIETLARQLTLKQETVLQDMRIGPQTGIIRRVLQGLEDAKNAFTASDIDDPIKKLADNQCKLLAASIMQGKLDHHPSLADIPDLMAPILGAASGGSSPAAPRPVVAVASPGSSSKPRPASAGLAAGSLSTKGILDSMTVASAPSTPAPLALSGPLSRDQASTIGLELDRWKKKQEAKMMAHREETQAEAKAHRAELAQAQARQKVLEARLQQQAEELAHSKSVAEAIQKTLKEVAPDAPAFGSGNQAQLSASAGARSPFFTSPGAIHGELGSIKDHVQAVGATVMVQSEAMENFSLTQARQQEEIERLARRIFG